LKPGLAFGSIIALAGLTAWLGTSNLAALNERMDHVLAEPVQRLLLAQKRDPNLILVVRAQKNLLLEAADPNKRATFDAELGKLRDVTMSGLLNRIEALATQEGKRRLGMLRATRVKWIDVEDRVRSLARDGNLRDAVALSVSAGRELAAQLAAQAQQLQTSIAYSPRRRRRGGRPCRGGSGGAPSRRIALATRRVVTRHGPLAAGACDVGRR
jgi:methyl-accepting chemotaxis protein